MFTWIPIFREITEELLTFEDKQQELLSLLSQLKDLKIISLEDESKDGSKVPLSEIDPFTFFANINRSITVENKQHIISAIKSAWWLQSIVPLDFDGLPVVNNRAAWFFAYVKERKEDDIPKLWKLARECFTKDSAEFDPRVLDDCLPIKTVGLAKLTCGMFWLNPTQYFAVDKKNRALAEKQGVKLVGDTASDYFTFLKEVREKLGNDFPALSHQAELESKQAETSVETRRSDAVQYWAFSAGEHGEKWPEFFEKRIIGIDYRINDLGSFATREDIKKELIDTHDGRTNQSNNALACWQFAREMAPGDVVIAKQGMQNVLGCGRVISEYIYELDRPTYNHIRKVEWLTSGGPWTVPDDNKVALKTLTDVTSNKPFLKSVSDCVGMPLSVLEGKQSSTPETIKPTKQRYWWLNANPKIWDFAKVAVDEAQTYTSYNEKLHHICEMLWAYRTASFCHHSLGWIRSLERDSVAAFS